MRRPVFVLLLGACGGHSSASKPAEPANSGPRPAPPAPDRCQAAMTKARPVLEEMMTRPISDEDLAKLVSMCKTSESKGDKEWLACMDTATDHAAVKACLDHPQSETREKRVPEAAIVLNKIAKNAKTEFLINAAYPVGRVGPTPKAPCCSATGHTCPVSTEWDQPVWRDLELEVRDETHYQYTYESDGISFVATAIGDLDCDGTAAVWTVTGTIVDGQAKTALVRPPPGVY